ncbi:MAG: hypothetical protein HQK49_06410 [Oligoflexia bacterium]|nr:hypothetical protein [Oligoflexia bacterium]
MRIHLFLIIITIIMAFILGRWSYLFKDHNLNSNRGEEVTVENTIRKMFNTLEAKGILDITRIYGDFEKRKLLDPNLYKHGPLPKNEKINCFQAQKESLGNIFNIFQKDLLWQQFQCSYINELPDVFFEYPPYMHSSGKSYIYLYHKMKGEQLSRDWIERNLSLFHILELNEIKKEKNIIKSKSLDILGSFDPIRLHYLLNSEVLILLDNHLLVKKLNSLVKRYYYIFDLNEVQKFLENGQFTITENRFDQKRCLLEVGNSCWRYSTHYLFQMVGSFSFYLFIATIILLILTVIVLIKNIIKERRDAEQRKNSLQILTHEFRTPVSSMLFEVEKIQQNFNHIGIPLQDSMLRLSNDVYRLQRLVEKSSSYLNLSKQKVFQFQLKKFDSINDFMNEIIDHYFLSKLESEHLKIIYLQQDSYFYFDPHWMGICLKNLIDNSFAHGSPPVSLRLNLSNNNELMIEVSDQGSCSFKNIEQMCADFVKSNKSKGMGLGLKIVKKIVDDLGGQLHYLPSPTRFQIKLNRQKLEKIFYELQRL